MKRERARERKGRESGEERARDNGKDQGHKRGVWECRKVAVLALFHSLGTAAPLHAHPYCPDSFSQCHPP